MNDYFNYKIPYFNEQYGVDWEDYCDIMEDNTDYAIGKIVDLYKLNDITRTPLKGIDIILDSLGIIAPDGSSLIEKKKLLRNNPAAFRRKGLEDFYLDPIEEIVGIRGEIYSGYYFGSFVHDYSIWPDSSDHDDLDWVWTTIGAKFIIYIDVKTEIYDELTQIIELLAVSYMNPAFYRIYLINSDFNIIDDTTWEIFLKGAIDAYYSFNNTADLGHDDSDNGNDLTLTDCSASGGAIELNGTTSFMTPGSIFDYTTDFAIAMWIYPENIGPTTYVTLFSKDDGSSNFSYILLIYEGYVMFQPLVGDAIIFGEVIVNDTWQFIVLTVDGLNIRLIVDGVEYTDTLGSALSSSVNPAHNLYFGVALGSSYYFDGKMDDIILFNTIPDDYHFDALLELLEH